jgi:hypothetical protein
VGPLKFKNMQKVKDFLRSFVAILITMIGVYFFHFYMVNGISIVSIILGILGFLILHPAVKKWESILGKPDANEE